MAYHQLSRGVPVKSFDVTTTAAPIAGLSFGVPRTPDTPKTFGWRSSYAGGPSAVDMRLQGSLDDVNFFDLDTSTATAGEFRTVVDRTVLFVRLFLQTRTGGTSATGEIVMS